MSAGPSDWGQGRGGTSAAVSLVSSGCGLRGQPGRGASQERQEARLPNSQVCRDCAETFLPLLPILTFYSSPRLPSLLPGSGDKSARSLGLALGASPRDTLFPGEWCPLPEPASLALGPVEEGAHVRPQLLLQAGPQPFIPPDPSLWPRELGHRGIEFIWRPRAGASASKSLLRIQ